MRPTICEFHIASLGELGIGSVAIDLQNPAKTSEMSRRSHVLAIGRVDIGHARWRGALPGTLVARIGPELALLHLPASRIKHRGCGLVSKQFGRLLELFQQSRMYGAQYKSRSPNPIR